MFTHLHTHSYFSLQEALPSPLELAQAAHADGMTALALTDHLYMGGAVEFVLACRVNQVQPILGLEIDLAMPPGFSEISSPVKQGALVLLAMDTTGWSNLCRLSSHILVDYEENTTCSLDDLAQFSQGLLCLSGGNRSLVDQLLVSGQGQLVESLLYSLTELFPDRLYVELQSGDITGSGKISEELLGLAQRLSLPVTAAQPVYYMKKEQVDLQRTLTAIRLICPRSRLPAGSTASPDSFFHTQAEMERRFAAHPEALATTQEIASRCRFDLPLGIPHYPQIPLPEDTTPLQLLSQKAEEGAKELYGQITLEIRQRLNYELTVIGDRGYESIFLIMEELLQYARQQGIPFSSRGSAASSLVAHCLGITSPDPLRLDLYFERFLNPARTTPPDIDTDLCSRRRDEVIQHVFDQYGSERVAMVGTINRFRARSALGDVAKAHGFSPAEVRKLVSGLPYWFHPGQQAETEESEQAKSVYAEISAQYPAPRYQVIFQEAEALLGNPRHLSVHAGGVVMAPCPLTDLVPIMRSGSKGTLITQLDLDSVEMIGLVKIDLLGIRGLTVLGDVADAIHSWQRNEFTTRLDVLDKIPEQDTETSATIEAGRTIGCFQIESPGMRATLKEIRARSIDDLMVALALYRPGPLGGGLKDAFVRRHKGEEPVVHIHPALAPLLEDTHGVILYQEQVLRIAHGLAGLSLAESDLLRRAMSHFDPGKQMQILREKFIAGAWEHSHVDAETAAKVWEMMAAFAGYGFPKAHAASYAQIAWRSAWCKTHFPAEFMASVLANWGGYYNQRIYLTEARRTGLTIHPPHINHSRRQFSVVYPQGEPELYMGLDQVRELTGRTQERIIHGRPFQSLEDFMVRADPREIEAENLIRVGALNGLGSVPRLLAESKLGKRQHGQMSLFGLEEQSEVSAVQEGWSLADQVAAEEEILGISVAVHPLELVADKVAASKALTTVEAAAQVGHKVRVAGVRQTIHRSRTGRGDMMAFLSLEDLEGILDVIIFPDVYRRCRSELVGSTPLLVEGNVELNPTGVEPVLRAEKIFRLG